MSSLPYSTLFEENEYTRLAGDRRDIEYLKRRFYETGGGGGGQAVYAIEVFEADVPVVAGDNAFEWGIPEHLDGAVLVAAYAYVTAASTSGAIQVQVANERYAGGTVDMFSTKLSIDVGELNSYPASATQPVIDLANDQVAFMDHLRIDVDNAGTNATGLGVVLLFIPNDAYVLAIQGATGPPGGVTAWTGAWQTATGYTEGQSVSHNGTSYVAIQDHTSGAASEPGVGVDWEDYWQVLAEANVSSGIGVTMTSPSGFPLDVGVKGWVQVPFDCEIVEVVALANVFGSVVVDVWKDGYGNFPPTDADSITGSSPISITSAQKSSDAILSGWTTLLNEGDILAFNVDSCSLISLLSISLKVVR